MFRPMRLRRMSGVYGLFRVLGEIEGKLRLQFVWNPQREYHYRKIAFLGRIDRSNPHLEILFF
jgi:hypothetical protein